MAWGAFNHNFSKSCSNSERRWKAAASDLGNQMPAAPLLEAREERQLIAEGSIPVG